MALPKIRKDFKAKLKESTKAILFQDFDGKEYWVPKSICTLIKEKNGLVVATLAAFKFEEITGIEPEDMATSFLSMGGEVLPKHRLNIPLVLSKNINYYPKQLEQLNQMVKSRYVWDNGDAGTGKTLMACTLAASYLSANIVDAIAVLCPASLQMQWKDKMKEYYPEMPATILSIEANSFNTSLPKMLNKFNSIPGRKHLICDEIHMIKNLTARRTKNIDRYYKAECMTGLTATSIGRNAGDLYYQYSLGDRQIIGEENFNCFGKHFLLFGGMDGDKVVALQNTKELSNRLSPYTFFRTKKDIRPDMPDCHFHKVYYEMESNQRQAYSAINGLINQIQARSRSGYIPKEKSYQIASFLQKISCGFIPDDSELQNIFGNLGLLGEAADNVARIKEISYRKENQRIKIVEENVKLYGSQQAIIWCSYRDELSAYQEVFPSHKTLIGGTTVKKIDKTMKDFKDGKFQYLIAMQQMGTGFDIPWVNYVHYSTTIFDYIKRDQSVDRVNRINREGDSNVFDYIAKGSIDERIQKVLEYKEEITSIFNGKQS